jgi:hypothetical protein
LSLPGLVILNSNWPVKINRPMVPAALSNPK